MDSLFVKFDYLNGRVNNVSDVVETLQKKMVEADERTLRSKYKCIDLEAQSRRVRRTMEGNVKRSYASL